MNMVKIFNAQNLMRHSPKPCSLLIMLRWSKGNGIVKMFANCLSVAEIQE